MPQIVYVREKCGSVRDESRGYTTIQCHVTEVEVHIELSLEEAMLIRANRRGDRRLATLLGPALEWHFQPDEGLDLPSVTVRYGVTSNPHRVRRTHLIAQRTLSALENVLRRLAQD